MEAKKLNTLTTKIFLGIFFLLLLLLLSTESQAKRVSFLYSSVVPAARGYVKINRDNNSNFIIKIHLIGLAEVERLEPTKLTYVVWIITDREITKNIGQLESSTSFLSQKLKASLETASSFKPVKIFITTENDASVQYPGVQVVLSTARFSD